MTNMTKFAVWGSGPSSSSIVRGGEYSDAAYSIAQKRAASWVRTIGDGENPTTEVWFVEVECEEAALDAETRFDSATVGYAALDADV